MIRTRVAVALATVVALVVPAHAVGGRQDAVWVPTMPGLATYVGAFPDGVAYTWQDGFNHEAPVLWRSADKGVTWERRELPAHKLGSMTHYVVDMATSAVGYALKLSELAPPDEFRKFAVPEVYRTDDGARTWRRLAVPFPALPGLASSHVVLRASTDGQGVFLALQMSYQGAECGELVDGGATYFMSTDGGESWASRAFSAPGWVSDVSFASARDAVVSVREARLFTEYYEAGCGHSLDGFQDALWTTHNGGRSFTRVYTCPSGHCRGPVAMTASGRILTTTLSQFGDRPVLPSKDAIVMASDDDGKSWRVAHTVPCGLMTCHVRGIDFVQGGRVGYLATAGEGASNYLWRTEDNGTTWRVDAPLVGAFAAGDSTFAISASRGFFWTRRRMP